MNTICKIHGFCIEESKLFGHESPEHSIRYFILAQNQQFFSTSNFALIRFLLCNCKTVESLFACCKKFLKCQKFVFPIKLSEVKVFNQPDKFWFCASRSFKITLILPAEEEISSGVSAFDQSKNLDLLVFSYNDEFLIHLHMFISKYSEMLTDPESLLDLLQSPLPAKTELDLCNKSLLLAKKFEPISETILDKMLRIDAEEISLGIKPKARQAENKGSEQIEEENAEKLYRLNNGSLYSGTVIGEFPEGKGKEFLSSGVTYVGYFKKGLWHGKGRLIDKDNQIFEVEFFEGRIRAI